MRAQTAPRSNVHTCCQANHDEVVQAPLASHWVFEQSHRQWPLRRNTARVILQVNGRTKRPAKVSLMLGRWGLNDVPCWRSAYFIVPGEASDLARPAADAEYLLQQSNDGPGSSGFERRQANPAVFMLQGICSGLAFTNAGILPLWLRWAIGHAGLAGHRQCRQFVAGWCCTPCG